MFAFAAARECRDQGHSQTLRAKLRTNGAQKPKDEAMNTIAARIEILSRLLLAIANFHADEENRARMLASVALDRLLDRDPGLTHFWQVASVLRDEIAARQGETSPPLRAYCVAA
ncbi:MAG: hypothetical protein ABL883_06230 [Terricaulis sp.]